MKAVTKKISLLLILLITSTIMCTCALLQKPIDNRTGFSGLLAQVENHIRGEEWEKAGISLQDSRKVWTQIKPLLQIDIDHDYVNDMEKYFVILEGYIDAKEKGNALAAILLLMDTWENIGEL